jgi:uncharacterized membrane protein YphA (DoxX/SURF4 family)
MIIPYLLLICRSILAFVLLIAVVGKIRQLDQLTKALHLTRVPRTFVRPIAIAVPTSELCLGVGLLLSSPSSLPIFMGLTAGLLVVFTGWMIWVRKLRLQLQCGCFGAGGANIGGRTLMRNGFLIILSFCSVILALRFPTSSSIQPSWLSIAIPALGLFIASLALFPDRTPFYQASSLARTEFALQNLANSALFSISRRIFLRRLLLGVSAALAISKLESTFAGEDDCYCHCYLETWPDWDCSCDCAGHPCTYCYAAVYEHSILHCCRGTPLECFHVVSFDGYVFCEECPC